VARLCRRVWTCREIRNFPVRHGCDRQHRNLSYKGDWVQFWSIWVLSLGPGPVPFANFGQIRWLSCTDRDFAYPEQDELSINPAGRRIATRYCWTKRFNGLPRSLWPGLSLNNKSQQPKLIHPATTILSQRNPTNSLSSRCPSHHLPHLYPHPLPLLGSEASFAAAMNRFRLSIPSQPMSRIAKPYFFIKEDGCDLCAHTVSGRDGDRPDPRTARAAIERIRSPAYLKIGDLWAFCSRAKGEVAMTGLALANDPLPMMRQDRGTLAAVLAAGGPC